MALGTDYLGQDCSLARALEIVGERWTLLIVRDAMFGVRRFSDFARRLGVSKAVLTQRLSALVEAGVMERVPHGGRDEYVLTEAGQALWPAMHGLIQWGDAQTSKHGPRRLFRHVTCGTDLDVSGREPRPLPHARRSRPHSGNRTGCWSPSAPEGPSAIRRADGVRASFRAGARHSGSVSDRERAHHRS